MFDILSDVLESGLIDHDGPLTKRIESILTDVEQQVISSMTEPELVELRKVLLQK
jgi:hypothetical protein